MDNFLFSICFITTNVEGCKEFLLVDDIKKGMNIVTAPLNYKTPPNFRYLDRVSFRYSLDYEM